MPGDITDAYAGDRHDPALALVSKLNRVIKALLIFPEQPPDTKHEGPAINHKVEVPPFYDGTATAQEEYLDDETLPTEEELATLRRIPDHIPVKAYTIALVELLERFSYYGTTAVFVNFISKPNPGTATGRAINPHSAQAQPGALGKGQKASTGLTTCKRLSGTVTAISV